MSYQNEKELEKLLIDQLKSQNYEEVKIPDYEALEQNFKAQFSKFNADKIKEPLSEKEWERIFIKLQGHSIFQNGKILRDKFTLERDNGNSIYLSLIDSDHTKNIFQVTHQTTVVGKYTNRYDVTLLVNGLPLVQIELKRRGADINEAINQIMRYKKHSYNGLYHYIQIFVVSNGVETKYFANSDKDLLYSMAFYWTDINNVRITNLKEFAIVFLARDHIVDMILKYTVLNETEKKMMVMRPYQVYATQALLRQALLTNKNAYIWHTTGSGKTLTSFKTAVLLSMNPKIKKVIFLVDRKDLDSQTTEEFNKFEVGSVDATSKTDVLVQQIKNKDKQLIVTTIQKMANAVKNPRYANIMEQYKNEKVVFIIDECHRSQFGEMHKDIVRHFSKAQFFGFTGTPRFEVNGKVDGKITQTTATLFGDCLHNYLIKDAISDNSVLGFHVDYIRTMKGDFDIEDQTRADAIDTEELYMADERMTNIANHIVQNHFSLTRSKQYTAIFAVSSIPMLIKYYDIFKKIDHDLTIGAIFTFGQNEDAEGKDEHSRDALERIIKDYNETFNENFSTDNFHGYQKNISDRVKGKKAKALDILIVVNMFLTGFDSKPLSVLYVDKDLKYHDLIQAYSRTNRVEKTTKPFGIIICYRNLKQKTDEAIALFSKGQSEGVLTPPYEYFVQKFNETAEKLKRLVPSPSAIDALKSEDEQLHFIMFFRELTKYLNSLRTFIEFNIDNKDLIISDQEYQDYRSKYLSIYHRFQTERKVVSVLNDVDFCIELMESNRINVAYIMNLIRNINFSDPEQKDYDIQHIEEELSRADNTIMLKKVELLQLFLNKVVRGLKSADEIDAVYNNFENEEKSKEINAFAQKEDLDPNMLIDIISEYEFSGSLNQGDIRDSIKTPMTLLNKKSLVSRIVEFVRAHVEKYQ